MIEIKSVIDAEHEEEKDIEEEEADEMDEGRRKKTGAIEKSLVWRPARDRKLASEGDLFREASEDEEEAGDEEDEKVSEI